MTLRGLVSWGAFPAVLVGALSVSLALLALDVAPTLVVMAVVFGASFPVLALQRWMPYQEAWRGRPADYGIDLLHGLLSGVAGDLWRALTFGFAFKVSALLSGLLGATVWPESWPLLAQFALAMVVGDFGAYWVHRTCHTVPLFWRIHAMHHTSERLYAFSATRSHPVNVVLAWASQAFPLIVLGAPEAVLVLVSVFTAVHGLLQHANADLKHGWLNHVFATADLHRWHHSADVRESNSNYGSNLIFWDVVFGTRALPADRPHPARMGLGDVAVPENWFAHLALPLALPRYEALAHPSPAELAELDDFTLESDELALAGAGRRGAPLDPVASEDVARGMRAVSEG